MKERGGMKSGYRGEKGEVGTDAATFYLTYSSLIFLFILPSRPLPHTDSIIVSITTLPPAVLSARTFCSVQH